MMDRIDDWARHAGAGLSFLFTPGERPGAAALRAALARCQAQTQIAREERGTVEIVANGLVVECDALAPGVASPGGRPGTTYGISQDLDFELLEAVQLYPGVHLSGGLTLTPVTRAVLAVAAELAVALPVRAVIWHPANTAVEPRCFSRSVLAWLAGGASPALGLAALTQLEEGIVVSRGLRHFAGQEITVRAGSESLAVAAGAVDRIVRGGVPDSIVGWTLDGRQFRVEPSRHAGQILVWPADEVQGRPLLAI